MSAITPISDAELLHRYEKGNNEAAFSALVTRYQGLVLGAAFRKTGNLELAREVAQEVFATLARKARFLTGRASLGGWLHQAAIYQAARTVQSEARRYARQDHYAKETTTVSPPPAGSSADSDQLTAVDEALGFLSAADREVIVLHYFQDLSYPEMSKVLGVNEAAVRQRVSRALNRLGKRLREQGMAGHAVVLLLGAVGVQSSIAAPAGLASAALASAAAGGGASAYLLLTAILSQEVIKTAAVFLALTGAAGLWYTAPHSQGQEQRPAENIHLVATPEAATAYGSVASTTAEADGIVAEVQPTGNKPADADRSAPQVRGVVVDASSQRRSQRVGQILGPNPSRASTPAGSPVLAATDVPAARQSGSGDRPTTTESRRPKRSRDASQDLDGSAGRRDPIASLSDALPSLPDYQFPGVLGELAQAGGLPAVVDELRRVERLPHEAAKLYGKLLEDVLLLEPGKRPLVEGFLQDHYERLNEQGIAGVRPPEIDTEKWRVLREAKIGEAVDGVQTILSDVAPDPKVIDDVFTLVERQDSGAESHEAGTPLEVVTDVVSTLPKASIPVKLPLLR